MCVWMHVVLSVCHPPHSLLGEMDIRWNDLSCPVLCCCRSLLLLMMVVELCNSAVYYPHTHTHAQYSSTQTWSGNEAVRPVAPSSTPPRPWFAVALPWPSPLPRLLQLHLLGHGYGHSHRLEANTYTARFKSAWLTAFGREVTPNDWACSEYDGEEFGRQTG